MVIHGIGRFPDGKEFWNTRTDEAPYEYTPGVDRVIRGFEEGMREVRDGDRIVITMKPELAYGERGNRDIPPNATLVFDYEILAVEPLSIARLLRDGIEAGGARRRAHAGARAIQPQGVLRRVRPASGPRQPAPTGGRPVTARRCSPSV